MLCLVSLLSKKGLGGKETIATCLSLSFHASIVANMGHDMTKDRMGFLGPSCFLDITAFFLCSQQVLVEWSAWPLGMSVSLLTQLLTQHASLALTLSLTEFLCIGGPCASGIHTFCAQVGQQGTTDCYTAPSPWPMCVLRGPIRLRLQNTSSKIELKIPGWQEESLKPSTALLSSAWVVQWASVQPACLPWRRTLCKPGTGNAL